MDPTRSAAFAIVAVGLAGASPAFAQQQQRSPDVVVGNVDNLTDFGNQTVDGDKYVGVTASTASCNIGNANLSWEQLPDKRHPVIAINLYRLVNGRMEQLGQSWVKHGFFATNDSDCPQMPGVTLPQCVHPGVGNILAPGCSDPYGESLNANADWLGPRSKINPATGDFDPAKARDLTGHPSSTELQRIVFVKDSLLGNVNARYFMEAQYIAADDAAAGNARNNVTYREVKPIRRQQTWVFNNVRSEARFEPAVKAWQGASFAEVTATEGNAKTSVIVAHKSTSLGNGRVRYDYAIHNLNSDLAVGAFTVPARGIENASIGFAAVRSYGEPWSNAAWTSKVESGKVTWSAEAFARNPKGNAIRWGTMYNFWFISTAPAASGRATLTRFKPKAGASAPEQVDVEVAAPGG